MTQLIDNFGRQFTYLRLSITDACNFRCQYCLPNGYNKIEPYSFLHLIEIERLIKAFAGLGITKVRLTGGEPTIRQDFLAIAQTIAKIGSINKLALSSNGYKLANEVHKYQAAGISALNISIDSLNKEHFKLITGHDKLNDILRGLQLAKEYGFSAIKINTVFLKDLNHHELDTFIAWVKDQPISVRFIELMQTGANLDYFKRHHISSDLIIATLLNRGWQLKPKTPDAGPALTFVHDLYQGSIGIIAPYSKNFCNSCNRLRISARGELKLCLFGTGSYSLRHLLQSDDQIIELQETIIKILNLKQVSHYLHEGNTGDTPHLASIGG